MNYKKIAIVCSLFLFLIPLTNVKAFVFVDYIKNGNYAFFLFDLGVGNSTEIRITHEDSGNFTLFLFDHRPTKAYVKDDRTLNTAQSTHDYDRKGHDKRVDPHTRYQMGIGSEKYAGQGS